MGAVLSDAPSGMVDWLHEEVLFLKRKSQLDSHDGSSAVAQSHMEGETFTDERGMRNCIPGLAQANSESNFRIYYNWGNARHYYNMRISRFPNPHISVFDSHGQQRLQDVNLACVTRMEKQYRRVTLIIKSFANPSVLLNFNSDEEASLFAEKILEALPGISTVGSQYPRSRSKDQIDNIPEDLDSRKISVSPADKNEDKLPEARPQKKVQYFGEEDTSKGFLMGNASSAPRDVTSSTWYPINIVGSLHSGGIVRVVDVSKDLTAAPIKGIKWYVSLYPGKNPIFPATPTSEGARFTLQDSMVGSYIQARATRKKVEQKKETLVYSVATRGVVAINDQTAYSMLKNLLRSKVVLEVKLSGYVQRQANGEPLLTLAADDAMNDFPVLQSNMYLTRLGITLSEGGDMQGNQISFEWPKIFISREKNSIFSESKRGYAMTMFIKSGGNSQSCILLELASEKERDNLYHTIMFYKLQGGNKGFEKWQKNYNEGNLSYIKIHYQKAWENTSFDALKLPSL